MEKKHRRKFSAEFKAKVVLKGKDAIDEAIRDINIRVYLHIDWDNRDVKTFLYNGTDKNYISVRKESQASCSVKLKVCVLTLKVVINKYFCYYKDIMPSETTFANFPDPPELGNQLIF